MAEVLSMSPLSSPTSTITMLHPRPSSSDAFQGSAGNTPYQQPQRINNTPRSIYNSQTGYRGTSAAPVQPYAFQATPQLRQDTRTISGPSVPQSQSSGSTTRQGHRSTPSSSTVSSDMSSAPSAKGKQSPSKDDMFSGSARNSFIGLSSSIPDLSLTNFDSTPKSSPNRYRRSPQRIESSSSLHKIPSAPSSAVPSGSGMAAVEHLYTPPPQLGAMGRTASDDSTTARSASAAESAKRYRRRSTNSLETNQGVSGNAAGQSPQSQRPASSQGQGPIPSSTIRPVSYHSRTSSTESAKGLRAPSTTPPPESERSPLQTISQQHNPAKVPIRGSSTNPSPLSKSPITNNPQSIVEINNIARRPSQTASPAAQHLAALSDKDLNKGYKSRLRRAFSFGSAQELRRASENVPPHESGVMGEMDPEQAEIARKQEAAGIGAGIYSGQGGFTGSTDNLSISSTASSASMMLRKMGKGMKKGGRSLKGLFRPKSVIGVPAADGPVQPSLAQVSMVTVEAERQKVNVNAHPDPNGGGTGFPKLEKNSLETAHAVNDGRTSEERIDSMRKSIVGSDKERAEVLAAVKKGILKRSGTSSPMGSPDLRPRDATGNLTVDMPYSQSPTSSLPATPRDDRASRSMSSTNSDYFSGRMNVAVTRSMPGTPQALRNISFSPRIQFYDAWSASDYDRRGEIATCNRLTPMLAQQIKEELNTFKMEMEVHEMSKPHTHFF